mgnify:FL=1
MVKINNRFAFTLIELIFAIVIISIAVVSLPVLSKVTEEGIESNILQEAIFAGSAELMGASAGYWDPNSMVDANLSHISRVIDIIGDCVNDTNATNNRLRPGHIAQPLHRRCVDANNTVVNASNNLVNANFPSLNDAAHPTQPLFTGADINAIGYKTAYDSNVSVNRNNNIKTITVTVSRVVNGTREPITQLSMQSANIGEIDFYKRRC